LTWHGEFVDVAVEFGILSRDKYLFKSEMAGEASLARKMASLKEFQETDSRIRLSRLEI